jgi:hypothetical protein
MLQRVCKVDWAESEDFRQIIMRTPKCTRFHIKEFKQNNRLLAPSYLAMNIHIDNCISDSRNRSRWDWLWS